jgi:hypothetical protein
MKKLLYLGLGIVLMFASCGANESSTVNLDGREVSTIKIDNLEVMTEDLGKMRWDDAMKACADLGDGWRLPTIDEMSKLLYKNKEKIGGFAQAQYWTSPEFDTNLAWFEIFYKGNQNARNLSNVLYVRAVRDF